MSLNKFFNVDTGLDIGMDIGCNGLKANNIETLNIDTMTINGTPFSGSVTNPLNSNLRLGGFSIVEEIGLAPSLNIDQLDNTKDIKLKIAGVSKVDVKNNEITLNENLNMNNNNVVNVNEVNSSNTLLLGNDINNDEVAINPNINTGVTAYASVGKKVSLVADGGNNLLNVEPTKTTTIQNLDMSGKELKNVSVIDNSSGNLQLIGQTAQSVVELDPNGLDGVNINANTKNINIIANNDLLLKSNTSFLDIDSNLIRFQNAGVPAGQIDAIQWEIFKNVSMTNNNIFNINDASANRVLTDTLESQLGGNITSNNNIDMNNNNISNVNQVSSNGTLSLLGALGADIQLTCNNLNLQGASSINHEKIIMNNTITEHPIIVYLPALVADFPDPIKNLLVKINSSGNIQPIAYGDPDGTGVIGTTHEIVSADGLVPVQVGGICSFTPSSGQTINAGDKFERSNTGTPILFGTIIVATGVGTCGVALTGGTGATDGSVKILGLWAKNEHF